MSARLATAVAEVRTALTKAVGSVEGLRAVEEPGDVKNPPCVYVGPPVLRWETISSDPSKATFTVYVIVAASARPLEELLGYIPAVAEAVDSVTDAVTRSALAGYWKASGTDLPSYEITVEVGLY